MTGSTAAEDGPVLAALRRAVAAAPEDAELRLHFAEQLLAAGRASDALPEVAAVVAREPGDARAGDLLRRVLAAQQGSADAVSAAALERPAGSGEFDWSSAEAEVADLVAPSFVNVDEPAPVGAIHERPTLRLADVGGMASVKARLESGFFAPLRNPELSRLYGKSLRGGLLLYGPPGCGKTYIARAVAGELGARFLAIAIPDILDPLFGQSERNLREVFQYARRSAPCVVFLDEIDSLGQRRSSSTSSLLRGVVNQLLSELDGVETDNEGIFILAATNQPWEVDPALRRPGRLDRTLLVLPPDAEARREIFRHHLEGRPVEGIDLARLAEATEGLSGADIAYVCELSAERALTASIAAGEARMIQMADLQAALKQVTPSTRAWFATARNFVTFGEEDPAFAELREHMKATKRW